MPRYKTCGTCGVPLRIGKHYVWNSDGTISRRQDPSHKMVFYDCGWLDGIFANIEDLIGVSIERQVVESKALSVAKYIEKRRWQPLGEASRPVLRPIIKKLEALARINGYGSAEVLELDWKTGYLNCRVRNPYSVPLFCGDIRGCVEAIRRSSYAVECEQLEPDLYDIKCYMAPRPPEFADRFFSHGTKPRAGDIEHHHCPECTVPLEVSRFEWDLDSGIIRHPDEGMRMAIFGSALIENIWAELESELGDTIPRVVVDANRKYAESLMSPRWKQLNADDVKRWLAIAGMGNLADLEPGADGLLVRVTSPALPTVTVGEAVALYEFMTGEKPEASWQISEAGDLTIRIT